MCTYSVHVTSSPRPLPEARPIHPDQSPGFLLWRTTLRWQRVMTETLKPIGLTHVQFVLLASLLWFDSQDLRPSQRELADHASSDVMMTSQVLRVLEAKSFITRADDPEDARKKVLRMTPEGRSLAVQAVQAVEAADRSFFAVAKDQPALLELLTRLAAYHPG
jgi:DNA-binding MarR family transcriptional regulator